MDAVDEVILKITNYPSSGGLMGGTSHYATFLLTNDRGTQVFTKNGWKGANGEKVKWEILYEQNVIRFYGPRTVINGGSTTYKKK